MATPIASTSIVAPGRPSLITDVHIPKRTSRGLWRDAWRRLLRNKLAVAGMSFIAFMIGVAILANLLAPYDPNQLFPGTSYARPSAAHWLGTDDVGRDVLSRLIHGARVSLSVAIFAQLIILVIGLFVGGIAGVFCSRFSNLPLRFAHAFYAF